jgi:hypothetical protein
LYFGTIASGRRQAQDLIESMARMIYERFLAEPAYVFIEKPNAIGAEL